MSTIRIAIIASHRLFQEALCRVLSSAGDIVVQATGSAPQALEPMLLERETDVVLFDLDLDGATKAASALASLRLSRGVRLLFLTGNANPEEAAQAVFAGATGYLSKAQSGADLIAAIRTVASGGRYLSPLVDQDAVACAPAMIRIHGRTDPLLSLSPRERVVFELLVGGRTCAAIAEELGIRARQVEWHRACMMKKLELHSVRDLFLFATTHRLLPDVRSNDTAAPD